MNTSVANAPRLRLQFSLQFLSSGPAKVYRQPWLSIFSSVFSGYLLLRSLTSGKSAGPDITNELLKLSAPAIRSESLAAIVNDSLTLGIFPRSWKESIVSTVLKAGKDATKPVSYRRISLLSNASKVVEKVVHSQLIRHCLDNRIIPDEQFGFLRGRSAELQLLSNLEVWHESLDKRNHVHCVLLDAAKAFDRVDHTALLSMLQSIGLDHVSLQWFFSYTSLDGVSELK